MPVGVRSMRKVPGTGLSLYESREKTPTGLSNSFSTGGLTPEDLVAYARKYNLPTTSNREFQQAQYDMMMKTPEGRDAIKAMEVKYGKPRSGNYADNMLGARTLDMMMASPSRPMEDPILMERPKFTPKQPTIEYIDNNNIPLTPNPVIVPKLTPVEQQVVNQDEKHGKYVVERPNWSLWGTDDRYGGLGGYKNGNAPEWYNLIRQIKRGADRRMLRKYKEQNPTGTKYGGPMTDEQYYRWWKSTGNSGPAPKIGSVVEY